MKKILALLLAAALLGGAALAETDEQTRTRDITIEGVTETVNETLYTSSSGYSIWLQDGWAWQVATDETAADETVVAEEGHGRNDLAGSGGSRRERGRRHLAGATKASTTPLTSTYPMAARTPPSPCSPPLA